MQLKHEKILIAQPKNYPEDLLNLLRSYFCSVATIKKGYLAIIQRSSANSTPQLVIGVESKNFSESMAQLEKLIGNNAVVANLSFIDVKNSVFSNYFSKLQPWYEA